MRKFLVTMAAAGALAVIPATVSPSIALGDNDSLGGRATPGSTPNTGGMGQLNGYGQGYGTGGLTGYGSRFQRNTGPNIPTPSAPNSGSSNGGGGSQTWRPVPRADGDGYVVCKPHATHC